MEVGLSRGVGDNGLKETAREEKTTGKCFGN